MKNYSGIFIILGHKNMGEADKFVSLYNDELGKIKAIAKGSRKIKSRFIGHLESLNICKAQLYFGPRNTIITEMETLKAFKNIRENLNKTNYALKLAEFTNKLVYENQNIEGLQNLLTETLEHINKNESPQTASLYYIINLLNKTGLIPDFKETKTSLEEKYKKFFHYTQNNSLEKVKKVRVTETETTKIEKIIDEIIRIQTSF